MSAQKGKGSKKQEPAPAPKVEQVNAEKAVMKAIQREDSKHTVSSESAATEGKKKRKEESEESKEAKKQANLAKKKAEAEAAAAAAANGEVPAKVEAKPEKAKGKPPKAKPAAAPKEKEKKEEEVEEKGEKKDKGPPPLEQYMLDRLAYWEKLSKEKAAANKRAEFPIKVKIEGKELAAVAWKDTPFTVGKQWNKDIATKALVAQVNGAKWDMARPLEGDCTLELFTFDTPVGADTFWHSSAHILGEAIELKYKDTKLCIGPPLEEGGFYYDAELGEQKVSASDYKDIEKIVKNVIKQNQPFERMVLTRAEALEMFKQNPFKQEILETKVAADAVVTAYKCGPLIDMCRGPHVPTTGRIKAFKVTRNSSAYWMAKAENASLQRVYGISFPSTEELKLWEERMKYAEEHDHRRIGTQQKLFFFDSILSPGSCFFLPHGARLYNKLQDFIRNEYRTRGYTEVLSPNIYHTDLWKISGHYEHYKEDMFIFESEKQEFGLKPMNCPGHCLMFGHQLRSYRELPIRFADFGVLHRNETSGALSGLTRVRRFQQDDAHIFCRQDQIEQEVEGVLNFVKHVYGIFGFELKMSLSTRPEKYLGEASVWDAAEKALANVLDKMETKWTINPGDGAFYGPKIDIRVTDALGRKHQCATCQLDFQLPIRFKLQYKNDQGAMETPVIVHRAVLGSVERFLAVLIEHTGGKWAFWVSPRQIAVLPVSEKSFGYAREVYQKIFDAGFFVDLDDSNDTINRKIREAQLMQYNFLLILGEEEAKANTVTIRKRDNPKEQPTVSLPEFLEMCTKLKADYQ